MPGVEPWQAAIVCVAIILADCRNRQWVHDKGTRPGGNPLTVKIPDTIDRLNRGFGMENRVVLSKQLINLTYFSSIFHTLAVRRAAPSLEIVIVKRQDFCRSRCKIADLRLPPRER